MSSTQLLDQYLANNFVTHLEARGASRGSSVALRPDAFVYASGRLSASRTL